MLLPVKNRWLEHPWLDLLGAVCLTTILLAVSRWQLAFDVLGAMQFSDRMSLYTDAITVAGIFVGFEATALAAYLALSGNNIARLREMADEAILRQWRAAIGGTVFALVLFFIAKVFDREHSLNYAHWIAYVAIILAAARFLRVVHVFNRVVDVAAGPVFGRSRSANPIQRTGRAQRRPGASPPTQ